MKQLLNGDFQWVGPIVLATVLIIAFLIGMINGWKTALYFLVWNVAGFTTIVLMTDTIYGQISSLAGKVKTELQGIFDGSKEKFVTIVGITLIITGLIALNIVAFIIYLFFRKKLKNSMKNNKKLGFSNLKSRFIGGGIAVVTALPIATAMSVTAEEKPSAFSRYNNAILRGLTGTKFDEASTKLYDFINLANAALDITKVSDEVAEIFKDGGTPDPTKLNQAKIESLGTILNSGVVNESLLKSIAGDKVTSKVDFSATPKKITFETKITLGSNVKNNVLSAIAKTFGQANTTNGDVENYLKALGILA